MPAVSFVVPVLSVSTRGGSQTAAWATAATSSERSSAGGLGTWDELSVDVDRSIRQGTFLARDGSRLAGISFMGRAGLEPATYGL